MAQEYRTLRVTTADRGVLGVVMDAPPMNLIGPELVRDLVTPVRCAGIRCGDQGRGAGERRMPPDDRAASILIRSRRAEQIIGVAKAAIIYKISRDS